MCEEFVSRSKNSSGSTSPQEQHFSMGGINRYSASLIVMSTLQAISGSIVATASPSAEGNSFQRRAFSPRKYHGAAAAPASWLRRHVHDAAVDEYDYLVINCTNDSINEGETDSEARFAYELENERDFLRHCDSSYLLRDMQKSEKVIPTSSARHYNHVNMLFEV